MPGMDKAAGRMAALIMLLLLAGAALRGYVPAAERTSHDQTVTGPGTPLPMALLLGVSVVIVAVAFVARVRDRRGPAGSIGALSTGARDGRSWLNWRVVLIGLTVIFAWLMIIWLLSRFVGQHDLGIRARFGGADTGAPTTDSTGSSPPVGPRPAAPRRGSGGDVFGYLALSAASMLLIATAATAVATVRLRREAGLASSVANDRRDPDHRSSEPEALVRATELGLAQVGDLDREPRAAIIGCYAAMERELARVPRAVPQDCDTPTEVLARAVDQGVLAADNATQLVLLFAEARFSAHRMSESHRDEAIRILRLVLTELRSRA